MSGAEAETITDAQLLKDEQPLKTFVKCFEMLFAKALLEIRSFDVASQKSIPDTKAKVSNKINLEISFKAEYVFEFLRGRSPKNSGTIFSCGF